jgi:hypothetical protein
MVSRAFVLRDSPCRVLLPALAALCLFHYSMTPVFAQPASGPKYEPEFVDKLIGGPPHFVASSSTPRIALVDVPLIWLLHPYMKDYIFEEGSFLRPLPGATTEETRPVAIKHRVEQALKLAKEAEAVRLKTEGEIHDLQVEELNQTTRINADQDRLRSELKKQLARDPGRRIELETRFSQEMQKLEEALWKRKNEIVAAVDKRRRLIIDKMDQARSVVFLSPYERDERFAEMAKEIREVIEREMDEGRFVLAVNKGYLVGRPPPATPREEIYVAKEPEMYVNQYHILATMSLNTTNKQISGIVGEPLKQWLAHRGEVPGGTPGAGDIFGFVVRGGEDITRSVLNRIFEKHQVPQAEVALIMKVFETR